MTGREARPEPDHRDDSQPTFPTGDAAICTTICAACDGEGRVRQDRASTSCTTCHGTGRIGAIGGLVTVFRAVPRGVREIRCGDYVTLSREYGEHMAVATHGWDGDVHRDGDVLAATVGRALIRAEPADEDDPADPMEWRYVGPNATGRLLIAGADRR